MRQQSLRSQSLFQGRRLGVPIALLDQPLFFRNLGIYLRLMIEIIRHCGMNFRKLEVREVNANSIHRPAKIQVVHHDLRYPNPRQAFEQAGVPSVFTI
jgi:hypothetical protein